LKNVAGIGTFPFWNCYRSFAVQMFSVCPGKLIISKKWLSDGKELNEILKKQRRCQSGETLTEIGIYLAAESAAQFCV